MVWLSLLALAVRARRSDLVLQTGGGLLAAVVMALAVFIPMYHYSEINPNDFWNRTRGRMFGEQAFGRTDPNDRRGGAYEPSMSEQVDRFWEQRDVFEQISRTRCACSTGKAIARGSTTPTRARRWTRWPAGC